LYEHFSERVYFIALKELRSHADAEDVRNETMLRVIEAIRADRVSTPDALTSFVIGTARNVMRESLRKLHRVEPMADRDFAGESATPFTDHTVQKAIETVISRLKPRERDFLRLYYFEELPRDEISERLGIHQDRVRLIKSRALKSFKEIYGRLVDRKNSATNNR
jgi:RNA polymerase sigma factor (sigma-70 family)